MSQAEFQRGDEVPCDLTWGQRQQGAAEVAGEQTVSEVEEAVGDQEPHGGEVDGDGAGKPAAQGGPAWKSKGEDRRGIVDLPPAHDHAGHGEGVHPMGETHGERSSGRRRFGFAFLGSWGGWARRSPRLKVLTASHSLDRCRGLQSLCGYIPQLVTGLGVDVRARPGRAGSQHWAVQAC